MNIIDLEGYAYRRARPSQPASELPRNTVLVGDATATLKTLPTATVDCVVTSPPYHLLRRYQAGPLEIGGEEHVDSYVDRLVGVLDQIARVLKPTGSLWLNLGSSYSRGLRYGANAKSLLLVPERVALALTAHGWICRNKVVWSKTNPMPNSVRDRLSCTWEPIFHLTRESSYFYDLDAIRIPATSTARPAKRPPVEYLGHRAEWAGPLAGSNNGLARARIEGRSAHPLGKNPGDVWRIATAGSKQAHFAVYPEKLIERPIIATCPERCCTDCGAPWTREPRRDRLGDISPSCTCGAGWQPGVVLDPFIGSGTTAGVARRLDRDWLGIELNPDFAAMATRRGRRAA